MKSSKAIESFRDTYARCGSEIALKESINKSIEGQKIILEKDEIPLTEQPLEKNTDIVVSKKRTFEAASAYRGQRVCVINFANAHSPGGAVDCGANAQEESLCRCSTLYACINDKNCIENFYGPHNHSNVDYFRDMIYTPDITVFKDDETEQMIDRKNWFNTDVISCAAPNLSFINLSDEELLNFHEFMFERMFRAAAGNKVEVMILGAFGCGVFSNDPNIVSKAAKNALNKYANYFKTVEFAIFCRDYETENYTAFMNQFIGN